MTTEKTMTITYQFVWQPGDTTDDPGFLDYDSGTLEEAINLAKCYAQVLLAMDVPLPDDLVL